MTLNLKAHEREILSAYNGVVQSPNSQNWIILDYEGNSNILKVGDTGDDGIDELSTSFNSGKLQYGIAAVRSNAASQPKMILIQWQGEGVPSARLAATAGHANDLKRFLRGIHVVIIARSEDDVDPESILRTVAKLPTMNDAKRIEDIEPLPQGPIGSVYTPIKPNKDINLSERDQFWKKVEAEEASRRVEERRRADQRDAEADRDKAELSKQIHERLHVEENAPIVLNANNLNGHRSPNVDVESFETTSGSEGLIRGRKAMFEQKANELSETIIPKRSTGRADSGSPKRFVPAKEQIRTTGPPCPATATLWQEIPQPTAVPYSAEELGQRRVRTPSPVPEPLSAAVAAAPTLQTSEQPETAPASQSPHSYYEQPSVEADDLRAVALWDYQAADETEITFDPDDIITEIEQIDAGWWRGRGPDGKVGLFPANYVSLI
uniref:Drebrin-like protein n=1 Tax=Parascaris univalens TaxID=6257 RepID=A0A915B733_PARUN